MSINITVRQLEVFLAVAHTLSFSTAAAQVHLSQPALSAAIAKLEDALGARLFDRGTRNVALTPFGAEVFTVADRLVRHFKAALVEVSAFLDGKRGSLAVAASPSLAADFLPKVLSAFGRTHPLVQMQVHEALSDDALARVRAGQADLALTPEAPTDADLEHCVLFHDQLVVLCPRDHALAGLRRVRWRDLQPFGLIALKRTSNVRHMTEKAYARHGATLHPVFEVEYATTLIGFVAQGLGIGVLPRSLVALLGTGEVVHRRIVEPQISRALCMVRLKARTPSPAAKAFTRICIEVAARLKANS